MRRQERSCHRVMAALTIMEIRQLHDIVEAIGSHPESQRPASPSEAIRWALSELHAALVASGVIVTFPTHTQQLMERENVQVSQQHDGN